MTITEQREYAEEIAKICHDIPDDLDEMMMIHQLVQNYQSYSSSISDELHICTMSQIIEKELRMEII